LGVALWSSDHTGVTGQAQVTARVVRHQPAVWSEYVYRGKSWRSFASWVGAVWRLWRDVALGRVKSVYLVCSRSNGGFLRDIPALFTTHAGVRVVAHAHGSDIVTLLSARWLSPFARALYARCEIVVPSQHLLEPLREVARAPVHLCENYFAGEFGDAAGKPDRLSNVFTVLWNSNVMASKGFFDLAEAVRRVHGEGFAIRFLSIGQPLGDEEMPAVEAARRLDALLACGWFRYRGQVTSGEAIALLAEADAVALPSRYSSECQPLAIIQAMCTGKAVIASDIPALQATLRDYPAHSVPVCSVEAIANELRELCGEKQADPAAFALRRQQPAAAARERFSADRFDREMTAILLPDRAAVLS